MAAWFFQARVEGVRQNYFENAHHNYQIFHEAFTTYWIMRFREALLGFDSDLEMMKGVIPTCLEGADGAEVLEQDLFYFDPHHPVHLPPAGGPLMENLGVWANYVMNYSLMFTGYHMWYVSRDFPEVRDHYDVDSLDQDFIAFMRSVNRIDLDKLLEQSQENVDQVLDLGFTSPWTIQFQTALGKFESDLAVVKLLMNPCLKELGREYLDQELGGYDRWRPNALLPTVKYSLELRRDWVAEAMTDCWSYVRSEINYLLPQFPRVHEYGDGSDFEVGFNAFMGYTFKKPRSVGYLLLFKVKKTRMDEGGGGGGENERTIQEWVADKRKQSTLPFVRHTLWDAVLSFDARVEGLQQFFNLNSNHEVLHEGFITLWIMGFQDALDRFNPVLEMMKRVIQSCLNGVGEDLQHDLLVLEPHEPLPSPPKGRDGYANGGFDNAFGDVNTA
ncbi:hypothetical protein QJS10_CPA07g00274 [Acorus calamus]|uniref:Uncharacterized protein n=1 Tax=Acorus calamus TaxID=4465 RepID=A0AAV9EGN7_ACOCL|nr:hypothetical protein QJS10_CPA07g00274 [Acorus calamus]